MVLQSVLTGQFEKATDVEPRAEHTSHALAVL